MKTKTQSRNNNKQPNSTPVNAITESLNMVWMAIDKNAQERVKAPLSKQQP